MQIILYRCLRKINLLHISHGRVIRTCVEKICFVIVLRDITKKTNIEQDDGKFLSRWN